MKLFTKYAHIKCDMPTLTYLLLFTMTIIDINFKEHCIFVSLIKTIPCSIDIIKTGHYAHKMLSHLQ